MKAPTLKQNLYKLGDASAARAIAPLFHGFLFTLFLGPSATALGSLAAHAQTPHAPVGTVVATGLDAMAVLNGHKTPIKTEMEIYPETRIEAGKKGVTLLLREGTIASAIKLRPDTRVTLHADPGKGIQVDLESGGVLSDVHNPEKRLRPFAVRTHSAVMGVRGTLFFVKETPGKDAFLCTCHGEVGVKLAGDSEADAPESVIQGRHHDHPMVIRANRNSESGGGSIRERLEKASRLEEHTDAEGTELEAVLAQGGA